VKLSAFESSIARKVVSVASYLLVTLAVQASLLPGQTSSAPSPKLAGDYIDRIHQGDVLDIHVSGYTEYDWRGSINPEGFLDGFERITTPIYAQCKTLRELEQAFDKLLGETLRDPKTKITFADRSKRPYATIDGAVQTPLRLQLRRPARLSEIVVNAGGFTDRASGKVMISRPAGLSCFEQPPSTRSQTFDIDLTDLLAGDASADPIIVSGDLIVVIEASPVYLLGAVQAQGKIDYRPELTVGRAVDSAGGLAKGANASSVKIFRRDGGSKMIDVDLERSAKRAVKILFCGPLT
jgi:protein involved in polysaccharide export with SLBB domain